MDDRSVVGKWKDRGEVLALVLLLVLLAISFVWFAEATHRVLETVLGEEPLSKLAGQAGWIWLLVWICTFPVLIGAFPKIVRLFLKPVIRVHSHPDRSCRVLILALSPSAHPDLKEPLNLAAIQGCLTDPGCCDQFGRSPWRMPFLAIAGHLGHGRLERILVIPSADSGEGQQDGTHRELEAFQKLVQAVFPKGLSIVVETPSDLGVESAKSGIDFTKADIVCDVVERCYHHYLHAGFRDGDVLLDVTGGQVTPTIVGALSSFHGARRWQYVRVGSPVYVCDMSCGLAGLRGVSHFLEDVPEEILPDVEPYVAGRALLRFSLAMMLTAFHWIAVDVQRFSEGGGRVGLLGLVVLVGSYLLFRRERRHSRLKILAADDEPGKALVVILSDAGRISSVPVFAPSDLKNQDFHKLQKHKWRTPLEAVLMQLRKGQLKHVFVLCSPQSAAGFDGFQKAVRDAFPVHDLEVARIGAKPDFFSPEAVLEAMQKAADGPLRSFGRSVTADVTGGTKIASLATAAVALRNSWVVQAQNRSGTDSLSERCYRLDYAFSAEGE